jgi:hypothetical protein
MESNNNQSEQTESKKKKKPSNNVFHENCKFLVSKLVKEEPKPDWAREIRNARFLLNGYPEFDFWQQLYLPYKLNSLAFLFSERGRAIVREEYAKYSLTKNKPESYNFEDKNVIDIQNIPNKTKNLLEKLK